MPCLGIKRPSLLEKIYTFFKLSLKSIFRNSPVPWLLLLFLISAKGHLEIIDTEYSVRTALAILEDGSMLIEPVDPAIRERVPNIEETDKVYSQYGLGLLVVFLPLVLAGKVMALLVQIDERIPIDFLLSFYNVPFAILGLWFFRSILIRLQATPEKANLSVVLLAITTVYWKYTITDFSEITQAAFLLGALNAFLSSSPSKWRKVSFWCAILVAMKIVFVLLLPIFAAFAWIEEIKDKETKSRCSRLFDFCIFLVPVGLVLASVNYLRFGNPMETGYGSEASSFSWGYFQRDWFDYLFSTQRGIIPFNPILLFALPGWFLVPLEHRKFAKLCFGILATWFLTMCFWKSIQGGWCWGNRLLVPILPILFIPFAFVPVKSLATKAILLFLTLASGGIQLAAACMKTHECSVLRDQITATTGLGTPNQLPSTIYLFLHKLTDAQPLYPASVLGVSSEKIIDLSSYDSFVGLNLWPIHALKFLGQNSLCHAGSSVMLVLLIAIMSLLFYDYLIPALNGKDLSNKSAKRQ
jgi:hypothetical protein